MSVLSRNGTDAILASLPQAYKPPSPLRSAAEQQVASEINFLFLLQSSNFLAVMADIALLVVEESERRKNWEKVHPGMRSLERTPERAFALVASSALSAFREEAALLRDRAAAAVFVAGPPESSFALAAFDGLFSA